MGRPETRQVEHSCLTVHEVLFELATNVLVSLAELHLRKLILDRLGFLRVAKQVVQQLQLLFHQKFVVFLAVVQRAVGGLLRCILTFVLSPACILVLKTLEDDIPALIQESSWSNVYGSLV